MNLCPLLFYRCDNPFIPCECQCFCRVFIKSLRRFYLILKPSDLPWFHLTHPMMYFVIWCTQFSILLRFAETEKDLTITMRDISPTWSADSLTFDWKSVFKQAGFVCKLLMWMRLSLQDLTVISLGVLWFSMLVFDDTG